MKFILEGIRQDGTAEEVLVFKSLSSRLTDKGTAYIYSGVNAKMYIEDSKGQKIHLDTCSSMTIKFAIDDLVGPTVTLELI